jgi:hypothetical protein
MKHLYSIIMLVIPLLISGQENNVIYFGTNGKLNPEKNILKKEIEYRGKRRITVKTYALNEETEKLLFTERILQKDPLQYQIRIKGDGFSEEITRSFETLTNERFEFTDRKGTQLIRTGTTLSKLPLILQDTVTEYYPGGNRKSESVYLNNELVSNKNWSADGEKYIDNIFFSVEEEPQYKEGTASLHNHILKTFRNSKLDISQVEGKIVVGFVVMESGKIAGIKIERGLSQELNDVARRAVSSLMGEWHPAILNDSYVRYYQLFPINFIYRQYIFDALELRGGTLYWQIN